MTTLKSSFYEEFQFNGVSLTSGGGGGGVKYLPLKINSKQVIIYIKFIEFYPG